MYMYTCSEMVACIVVIPLLISWDLRFPVPEESQSLSLES